MGAFVKPPAPVKPPGGSWCVGGVGAEAAREEKGGALPMKPGAPRMALGGCCFGGESWRDADMAEELGVVLKDGGCR